MPQSKERHAEWMRERRGKARKGGWYKNRYCRVCGYSRVLDQHHLDSNHDNNEEDNLLDLCCNCHALITRKLATLNGLLEERQ